MLFPPYGRRAAMIQMVHVLVGGLVVAHGAALARAQEPLQLVALGDSLTAGYQLPPTAAFPSQLERALNDRGLAVSIANAGVSGDTSTGGLSRLDWAVGDGVRGVLLALGANDALRGVSPSETLASLDAIITRLKERGVAVLLIGMRSPPNMGPEFQTAFDAIYPALAAKHDVPLYPFFLDGVAAEAALNLPDGMHPNEQGVARIVERMLPTVEGFIATL